ncbi:DMSO reductase anchor subunit [Kluyvera cryocrescens]|uniref:DMSO reductase anchor subunit n=1 Tax=Kluyvera cryocrescens TaxID=580 RepID=A0A485AEZ4_KLUCR|nr:DMSO reductase anchor subunit [Kluyvera cryocrescens]
MGSGWHEWPLMIFTVFGQCVAGGFIVLALALMKGQLPREQQQRVVLSMFALWGADGDWLYRLNAASRLADARVQLAESRGGILAK